LPTVPCIHANYGCGWQGSPETLTDLHLPSCPYDALRGFFQLNATRTTHLEQENKALKMRLDASEGLMRILMGEVAVLKAAVGPYSTSSDTPFSHVSEDSGQQSHSVTSPLPSGSSDNLASYFPPAVPVDPPDVRRFDPPAPSRVPSGTSIALNLPSNSDPAATSAQAHQPLHVCLSALRSTIDSVRAEHEATIRDSEAARAQLSTEIGVLRASIGGLRMFASDLSAVVNGLLAERGGSDDIALTGPMAMSSPLAMSGAPHLWPGRPHASSYLSMYPHSGPGVLPHMPPFSINVKL